MRDKDDRWLQLAMSRRCFTATSHALQALILPWSHDARGGVVRSDECDRVGVSTGVTVRAPPGGGENGRAGGLSVGGGVASLFSSCMQTRAVTPLPTSSPNAAASDFKHDYQVICRPLLPHRE